jgi:lysophospholipase L1-like esterase
MRNKMRRSSAIPDFVRSRPLWSIAALLTLLGVAELAARVFLGLGNPVLYVADPTIEYMLRPNQDVRRFGKHIFVNQYAMRSESFPEHKRNADELRVLVMGDSVVNGGNRTDQSQLATTLLRDRLVAETRRPVVVGNVSAGSWGPPNMLEWTRSFGFLAADVVVVVLSSHDASDVPTFASLDSTAQPTARPISALLEGMVNYLPRILPWGPSSAGGTAEMQSDMRAPDEAALDAFSQLVRDARRAGACVSMVQHLTKAELADRPGPGHRALQSLAAELSVPNFDDAHTLSAAVRTEPSIYRDNIHFSDAGQRILADELLQAVARCEQAPGR